ncbi:MAG: glycosyltransferase family 4 protein [Smithellaceae bacterium]|nr:glycosyltransferase family 4 protein [Smithellaceae bacterium]
MRILMLGWEFPPHISGGLGTACQGITEGLTGLGHEIIFILPRLKGPVPPSSHLELLSASDVPVPLEKIGHLQQLPQNLIDRALMRPLDSPLHPYLDHAQYLMHLQNDTDRSLETTGFLPLAGDYGRDLISEVLRYGAAAAILAARQSFDVIHAHDWMTIFAGVTARLFSGKPLVLHVHALEIDRSGEKVNREIFDIESFGLNQADRVIAVSHYTKERIIRFYGIPADKITVVHNAVSQEEARRTCQVKRPSGGKMVLFLGRITFQKGPDYFIEAASRVLRVMPEVKFIMAGSGDMMPRMIERVAELGIGRSFHFTGFLRGPEVEEVFALSDLYVMPSVSEPFGISPLEAMSYDVPVIISRQSGVSELINHALKVDFWNIEEIADRIIAVLRHPVLANELMEKGREELKKIRWSRAAERIAVVYREVLSR